MRRCLIIILACLHLTSFSQVVSTIIVSHDSLLVGDPVAVLYKLQVPNEVTISALDYQTMVDSLLASNMITGDKKKADAEFEGIQAEKFLLSGTELPFKPNGVNKVFIDTFKLTLYQTGAFTLQTPTVKLGEGFENVEIITSEFPELIVGVTSRFLDVVTTNKDSMSLEVIKANLAPNVENIYTEKKLKDYWPYFALAAGLLLLGLIYLFIKTKEKRAQIALIDKPKAPAHYFAYKKLAKLKGEQLWKVGKDKEYQTQLTYTIREYLENRFNIKALESTTEEIKSNLVDEVTTTQETELVEILQIADLVKFAKAKPSEDINESFLRKAEAFVKSTMQEDPEFDESTYLNQDKAYREQQKKLS